MNKPKIISNTDEIQKISKLTENECLRISTIMDLFGDCGKGAKYNTCDIITIPPNSYGPDGKRNKNSFTTTVGLWVFNKAFIEKDLFHLYGYINEQITGKKLEEIRDRISNEIMLDRMDLQVLKDFIKKDKYLHYNKNFFSVFLLLGNFFY